MPCINNNCLIILPKKCRSVEKKLAVLYSNDSHDCSVMLEVIFSYDVVRYEILILISHNCPFVSYFCVGALCRSDEQCPF